MVIMVAVCNMGKVFFLKKKHWFQLPNVLSGMSLFKNLETSIQEEGLPAHPLNVPDALLALKQ